MKKLLTTFAKVRSLLFKLRAWLVGGCAIFAALVRKNYLRPLFPFQFPGKGNSLEGNLDNLIYELKIYRKINKVKYQKRTGVKNPGIIIYSTCDSCGYHGRYELKFIGCFPGFHRSFTEDEKGVADFAKESKVTLSCKTKCPPQHHHLNCQRKYT